MTLNSVGELCNVLADHQTSAACRFSGSHWPSASWKKCLELFIFLFSENDFRHKPEPRLQTSVVVFFFFRNYKRLYIEFTKKRDAELFNNKLI